MKRTIFRPLLCVLLVASAATVQAVSPIINPSPTPAPAPAQKSYTLAQCLQIAADHNPELRLAATQFIQAKGRVIQLHAILYPTLNAQAFTTPELIYVQFNQVLYTEATFPQLRLSRLTEEQAYINYRQTLNDVIFQVRQGFTTVIGARDRLAILTEFNDEKLSAIKSAQQLFDAGEAQKSVLTNVQVQQGISRYDMANAQVAYKQARLLFDNLIGQALPPNAKFIGDYSVKVPENLDTGKLIDVALQDREDLQLLESQKLSSEQQIRIDMKNAYPIIGVSSNSTVQPPSLAFANSLNAEANYNEPQTVVGAGQTQLPLSLYFTWIIFDGGNLRGVKMSDKATIATQAVAIDQLKQSVTVEVSGAVSQILTQQQSLQTMQGQPNADELRRLAEASYQAGQLRQLDKVNLENDILSQELLHLNSEYQLALAAAALDHALGHGLKIIRSNAQPPHL